MRLGYLKAPWSEFANKKILGVPALAGSVSGPFQVAAQVVVEPN